MGEKIETMAGWSVEMTTTRVRKKERKKWKKKRAVSARGNITDYRGGAIEDKIGKANSGWLWNYISSDIIEDRKNEIIVGSSVGEAVEKKRKKL